MASCANCYQPMPGDHPYGAWCDKCKAEVGTPKWLLKKAAQGILILAAIMLSLMGQLWLIKVLF